MILFCHVCLGHVAYVVPYLLVVRKLGNRNIDFANDIANTRLRFSSLYCTHSLFPKATFIDFELISLQMVLNVVAAVKGLPVFPAVSMLLTLARTVNFENRLSQNWGKGEEGAYTTLQVTLLLSLNFLTEK